MNGCWIRRDLIALLIVIWLVQFIIAIVHPDGDFRLHHEFGRRLRTGEFLYGNGMHIPYPPAWAVPHVPLSFLPLYIAKPAFHVVGAAFFIALLLVLNGLTRTALPINTSTLSKVLIATLVIAGCFVVRDFDDGGQNIVLLTLAWIGLGLFVNGRFIPGSASLGLAVALKCTAGIFVLYFCLKREWKMAFGSLAWAGVFSLTPLLWQSPEEFRQTLEIWKSNIVHGLSQPDPTVGVLGPELSTNKSLKATLVRYLMTLPPGHPGRHYLDDLPEGDPNRLPHPWSFDVFDLSAATAALVIKFVTIVGLLLAGWMMRGRLMANDRLRLLWEFAIVGVLALLFSPITWGQHCVAVLPAVYLLIRGVTAQKMPQRWIKGFLIGFMLLLFITNRGIVGKQMCELLESYHVITGGLIGLIVAMFLARPQRSISPLDPE